MDKNKPSASPPASPLTRTDDNGVQWGFEPAEKRWFAIVNGKKSSSQDFSKLSDKVTNLLAKAREAIDNKDKPVVAVPEVPPARELVLITQHVNRGFFPIMAKVEWNAAIEGYEILRYKEFKSDGKPADGGWHSSGASSLRVFHPECLGKKDRSYLTSLTRYEIVERAIKDMESRTWAAWRNVKQDHRLTYENSFRNGQLELGVTERFDYHSSRRQAHISPNLPHVSMPTPDLVNWETTAEGHCRRGEVSIRLGESTSRFVAPSIEVWVDRWPNPVYRGDFDTAATLANATVEVLESNSPPVREWHASAQDNKNKSSSISWPTLWEQWGGAVFSTSKIGDATVYGMVLCQELESPMHDAEPKTYSGELKGIAWRRRSSSSAAPVFLSVGPEDQLLEQLDRAIKLASEFVVAEGLVKKHAESSTWWRHFSGAVSTLPAASSQVDVLREVVGLHDDDPEAMIKDPVQVASRFNRELARIERQVSGEAQYARLLDELGQVPRADLLPARASRKP